jgi:hypothetical protein
MPKVKYNDITFDSELEVEYYKYLRDEQYKYLNEHTDPSWIRTFYYHPAVPIKITKNNTYVPDFVVFYKSRIEIVEVKGYNPYSKKRDDIIHQVMLAKSEQELRDWLNDNYGAEYNGMFKVNLNSFRVVYRKIKYLKAYGFVDWDFKNPNTIANKRKEKINDLSTEIKALRDFKKDAERYFRYHIKVVNNEKLTKPQKEWYYNYVKKLREEYGNNNETN